MSFVISLYKRQVQEGRVFLYEHPKTAKTWSRKEVERMMNEEGVSRYHADQCMYGLKTWDPQRRSGCVEEAYNVHDELPRHREGTVTVVRSST